MFQRREDRLPGLEESGRREEMGQILRFFYAAGCVVVFALVVVLVGGDGADP